MSEKSHLIMTDEWFDEYMFRLVVETKYVPAKIMELLSLIHISQVDINYDKISDPAKHLIEEPDYVAAGGTANGCLLYTSLCVT